MARARNIKPGFFKNEDLAECTPWARLCFAGLWTLADRDGRLEDRPKRIKGELFAYDSVEVEPLLVELERFGFVERYRNTDGSFIQISKFSEHQTPHYSEKPSVIKPPNFQESKPDDGGNTPSGLQVDSKKEAPLRGGRNPLNPDSLNPDSLNPDSLNPDSLNLESAQPRRASRRTQIDPDFYPNDANLQQFNKTGLNLGDEIGKFLNHHQAKGSLMADWQAAWRTWVAKAAEFQKSKPTGETPYQRSKRELFERATGQSRTVYQPNSEFVEALGALQ